jgi:hypothetical protein
MNAAWYVVFTAVVLQSGIAAGSLQAADDKKPSPDGPKVCLPVADTSRLELKAFWGPITESGLVFTASGRSCETCSRPRRATYDGAAFRALLPAAPLAPGELWELNDGRCWKFLATPCGGKTEAPPQQRRFPRRRLRLPASL